MDTLGYSAHNQSDHEQGHAERRPQRKAKNVGFAVQVTATGKDAARTATETSAANDGISVFGDASDASPRSSGRPQNMRGCLRGDRRAKGGGQEPHAGQTSENWPNKSSKCSSIIDERPATGGGGLGSRHGAVEQGVSAGNDGEGTRHEQSSGSQAQGQGRKKRKCDDEDLRDDADPVRAADGDRGESSGECSEGEKKQNVGTDKELCSKYLAHFECVIATGTLGDEARVIFKFSRGLMTHAYKKLPKSDVLRGFAQIFKRIRGQANDQCPNCGKFTEVLRPARHQDCHKQDNSCYLYPSYMGIYACLCCGTQFQEVQHLTQHYVAMHSEAEVECFGYKKSILQRQKAADVKDGKPAQEREEDGTVDPAAEKHSGGLVTRLKRCL